MLDDIKLEPAEALAARNPIRQLGESEEYRAARQRLLVARVRVAPPDREHRRRASALPPGALLTKDYRFEGEEGEVSLADLFGGHDSLFVYSYMFGPQRKEPCPMCTGLMNALALRVPAIRENMGIAFTARSPLARLVEAKRDLGMPDLPVYSDVSGDYTRDWVHPDDADIPGPQRLPQGRRRDPPLLLRRDDRKRSRPGPARRARDRPALGRARHGPGRTAARLVSRPSTGPGGAEAAEAPGRQAMVPPGCLVCRVAQSGQGRVWSNMPFGVSPWRKGSISRCSSSGLVDDRRVRGGGQDRQARGGQRAAPCPPSRPRPGGGTSPRRAPASPRRRRPTMRSTDALRLRTSSSQAMGSCSSAIIRSTKARNPSGLGDRSRNAVSMGVPTNISGDICGSMASNSGWRPLIVVGGRGQDELVHLLGVPDGELESRRRAHGVAEDVGLSQIRPRP